MLERELAKQVEPIVCAHAGIEPLDEEERKAKLANYDGEATIRVLASLQSKLDVATTTTWTQGKVEQNLLDSADIPWSRAVADKINSNGRLVPPRSMTQLFRETLEISTPKPDADDIPMGLILHLIMSITTGHLRNDFSKDGTLDDAGWTKIAAMAARQTPEESLVTYRQIMLDEIANLHSNAPLKLEALQADTQNMWFSDWPERVTDPRLGQSPADCFLIANKVELIDVLVLGSLIIEGAAAGEFEFSRDTLTSAGATEPAVSLLFEHMSYSLPKFKSRLSSDRRHGPVADQRYAMAERPFVLLENGNVLLLRYQWALDRFFGSQLYWQTFFPLGPLEPGSISESFSLAMNDMFERATADVLEAIVASSRSMTRVIREPEMQAKWIERAGQTPSVCDFVIPAGKTFFVMDATNHHLNFSLAQGLGTIDDYAKDAEESLVKKCEQIAATIGQLRRHGDYGVTDEAQFLPIVVVPINGVPNLGSTEFDLQLRAQDAFAPLLPQALVIAPTVLRLPDLELIEGIAEHYPSGLTDVRDLLSSWRHASMSRAQGPLGSMPLQEFLDERGIARPLPIRMFAAQRELATAMRVRLSSSVEEESVGQHQPASC